MSTFRMMALGAALVIGVSTTAQAQGAAAGRQGQRGAQMREVAAGPLFRGITLSDAQKTQLRTVGERYNALRQEMRKDPRGGAQGAGERQRPDSATRARMSELMQKQQGELRAILTADQQKTFDANVAQLRERGRDRVGQRNGEARPRDRAGRGA
jgi:Spy/CpxP family protein refolding chaperone